MGAIFDLVVRTARRAGLVVGPIFLVIAFGYILYTCVFLHSSITATGTVISLIAKHGEDDAVTFAPAFSFVAADGQKYTVTSDSGSNPSEFQINQSVRILYKKDDPIGAKISSFWQLWTFPVVFAFLGTLFAGVGCALLWYERWRDRRGLSIMPS
jgi:hypothetical protein